MDVEINKIYNESCLETMSRIPDNANLFTICSPPYNMNLRIMNGKYCSRQIVKELSTKYSNFNDNLPIDEFYKLHSNIIKELLRVSKVIFYNIQIVTGSKRAFFKIIGEFADNLKEIIVWDKMHGQPAMQSNVLNSRSELILVFENNEKAISRKFERCNFGRGTLDNVWEIKRGKKISKEHGAVFPIELVERILNNFATTGDIIYDPFSGTGTTAYTAYKNGFSYLGSEISKEYCELIESRINTCNVDKI